MFSRFTLPLAAALLPLAGCSLAPHDLEAGFRNPPAEARPHTWWHWMNGNITRAGITADLEAMKQIGLGGAQMFNVSEQIPDGPIKYNSPEWRALVKHAASEARRLNLELCMHNCAGWSSSGGPWITPEHAMQVVVASELAVSGPKTFTERLPQPPTQRDYYRDIAVYAIPTPRDAQTRIKDIQFKSGVEARYGQDPALDLIAADAIIQRSAILDLSGKLHHDGTLTWEVPAGDWTIVRMGCTATGAVNAPSPESGRGLECDKLSRAGLDAHWAGLLSPIEKDLGGLLGSPLNNCLIDSYEVGGQNWTPAFCAEFAKRRGYDPRPLLPVLTGRVIDSGEVSERFLWDYRRTIADLFADNYYSYFAELCHQHGLKASIEPYDGPFECLLSGRDADIPMGEFWVGGGESNSCKLAASVAHTYGKPIIGAESFTAEPRVGRWQNHPANLKAVGDLMYCAGINRYIVHRYAHQPWMNLVPGMTMGQWGTHFERTTTWWEHGGPEWVQYLARCQYLLQQGRFVADVCYFAGEDAPNGAPFNPDLKNIGYDYDACNADVLLNRATVRDGRLVLRAGMSYRLLVLPESRFMTPQLLAKVHELVRAGLTVIGPKPDHSPSLSGYPESDARVKALADELWDNCDGKSVKEHACGRGRVIWGRSVEDVLQGDALPPDCKFSADAKMAWIHRLDGAADFYFVSNQKPRSDTVTCTFRISGKRPELWHADTGVIEPAPLWDADQECTHVTIPFEPAGSVFVVFRQPAEKAPHAIAVTTPAVDVAAAPKITIQHAVYEAADGAGSADVTAKVTALVAAGETSIPANNATFGDPTYLHVKRLRVDFTVDGNGHSETIPENGALELSGPSGPARCPDYFLSSGAKGVELTALRPGRYAVTGPSGKVRELEATLPPPLEIIGPWSVTFQADRGAPAGAKMDHLASWTESADPGVRYFSGTADYETTFDLPAERLAANQALYLDLGKVGCIAEVTLNGKKLPTWWKPPFVGDITSAAHAGRNSLHVRVTNLWVNRLIGDEQLPDDSEWKGIVLKQWPEWLVKGLPRTSGRITFTTWKHWKKDDPLQESGLIGPVVVRSATRMTIVP